MSGQHSISKEIQDLINSFASQIRSLEKWVSQNEIDQMTEFIYDALNEMWATRKKEFSTISEWGHAKGTERREVDRRIASIVTEECDRRNADVRKARENKTLVGA